MSSKHLTWFIMNAAKMTISKCLHTPDNSLLKLTTSGSSSQSYVESSERKRITTSRSVLGMQRGKGQYNIEYGPMMKLTWAG